MSNNFINKNRLIKIKVKRKAIPPKKMIKNCLSGFEIPELMVATPAIKFKNPRISPIHAAFISLFTKLVIIKKVKNIAKMKNKKKPFLKKTMNFIERIMTFFSIYI